MLNCGFENGAVAAIEYRNSSIDAAMGEDFQIIIMDKIVQNQYKEQEWKSILFDIFDMHKFEFIVVFIVVSIVITFTTIAIISITIDF